jgi:hypothetical protein
MKAVILAAGEGKRLRPFTETMPKVMLPVANKPVLEYVFDAVRKSGIDEIIVVVGYKKEVIMEYFKEYKDVKITYVTQVKQLGTAHALLQAKKNIKDSFHIPSPLERSANFTATKSKTPRLAPCKCGIQPVDERFGHYDLQQSLAFHLLLTPPESPVPSGQDHTVIRGNRSPLA